jgi:hypothetical protein
VATEESRARWRAWYDKNKEHRRKYKLQYRHDRVEQHRVYGRTRYAKIKDKVKADSFEKRYGISLEDRNIKLAEQGGVCASCGSPYPTKKGWMQDHDHETDELRGVLCGRCNSALGMLNDDPVKVEKLLQYILRYKNGPQFAGSNFEQEMLGKEE